MKIQREFPEGKGLVKEANRTGCAIVFQGTLLFLQRRIKYLLPPWSRRPRFTYIKASRSNGRSLCSTASVMAIMNSPKTKTSWYCVMMNSKFNCYVSGLRLWTTCCLSNRRIYVEHERKFVSRPLETKKRGCQDRGWKKRKGTRKKEGHQQLNRVLLPNGEF